MAIDWSAIDRKYYAPEGVYKTKLNGAEFKQVGSNGNYIIKFSFEESDAFLFPTADHWVSKNKTNFRIKHMKDLMVVLGATEENAKKACELAESKDSYDYAVQGYEKAFTSLAKKKPEVEIEIYQDGKFSRAEFTDRRVAMKRKENDDPLKDAEEIDVGANDEFGSMPF